MVSAEWLERHPSIDRLVAAALPPRVELERLSFDSILARYAGTVPQAANTLGLSLSDAEVEMVLERLVGVQEWPAFRREHYDLHC